MAKYILFRLLAAIPVLFGVSLAVFVMVRLVPGDPVQIMYANQAQPSAEQIAVMRHQLGLDQSIGHQYVNYLDGVIHGNLGDSIRSSQPVAPEIMQRLPNTLRLTVSSLAVALIIGLAAGILAATSRGGWLDRISMIVSTIGVSIPAFWLGMMVILLFGVRLKVLPVSGADSWKNLVMPAFTLGFISSAVIARVTRASMLEALGQDYVRTSRAKGLRNLAVVWRHALRNAVIPVLTIVGLQIGGLLSGAFIIETVFAYPGIGQYAVSALQARDFPVIQGVVLFVAVIYVAVNLVVDLLYGLLDPRVSVA